MKEDEVEKTLEKFLLHLAVCTAWRAPTHPVAPLRRRHTQIYAHAIIILMPGP